LIVSPPRPADAEEEIEARRAVIRHRFDWTSMCTGSFVFGQKVIKPECDVVCRDIDLQHLVDGITASGELLNPKNSRGVKKESVHIV
jgi:hypothetical protein